MNLEMYSLQGRRVCHFIDDKAIAVALSHYLISDVELLLDLCESHHYFPEIPLDKLYTSMIFLRLINIIQPKNLNFDRTSSEPRFVGCATLTIRSG